MLAYTVAKLKPRLYIGQAMAKLNDFTELPSELLIVSFSSSEFQTRGLHSGL